MKSFLKIAKSFSFIFFVLLISLCVIGGSLYYHYTNVKADIVPIVEVSINNQVSNSKQSVAWHTPVFGGYIYKDYFNTTPSNSPEGGLVLTTPNVVINTPAEYQSEIVVKDSSGQIINGAQEPGVWNALMSKNGVYSYAITLSRPKTQNSEYGTFTIDGEFTVNVVPSIHISSTNIVQGDIINITVSGIGELELPTMQQNIAPAFFAKDGRNYTAQIGTGYLVNPGTYNLNVMIGDVNVNEVITINAAEYGRQDLTISSTTVANTSGAEHLQAYRDAIYPLYETFDDVIYWQEPFMKPVDGDKINTEYGIYRYTNGSSSYERHAGIDYDGEQDDNIYAANSGRVVFASFLDVTGNTIVIEHGAGLKTYYYHLNEIYVENGAMVQIGDVIGGMGTTGYSTGDHLHYEVRIGNISINPHLLQDGTSGIYNKG